MTASAATAEGGDSGKKENKSKVVPPTPPPTPSDSTIEDTTTAATSNPTLNNIEEKGEEEENEEAATAAGEEGSPFLHNLAILPPRTTKKEAAVKNAIPLPPIRAEEPVSSLRAALSEVKGYAHITRYRLVLEQDDVTVEAASAPVANEAPAPTAGSGGKKGKKKKKTSTAKSSANAEVNISDVVSQYTLKDAVIMTPSSIKSLEVEPHLKMEDEEKKKEGGEIVLDEYGDLSTLIKSDNEDSKKGLVSGSKFRMVLERYDVDSIRDHVLVLRSLLDGNAPSVTSLAEESAAAPSQPEGGETDGSENAAAVAEKEKGDKKEPKGDGRKKKNGKKDGDSKKDAESERKSQLSEIAEKMPSFPLDNDVAVDGTDLEHFYYLSCGEEDALRSLQKEQNQQNKGSASQTDEDEAASAAAVEAAAKEQRDISKQLNDLDARARVPCKIRYSGFHPPPPHRKLLGDLAYLEVEMPGYPKEGIFHVTAIPTGFYVNRTSTVTVDGSAKYNFDPRPATEPCFSHELLDCLIQRSKSFRSAWADALAASKERAELSASSSANDTPLQALHRVAVRTDGGGDQHVAQHSIDSVLLRPPWLVPLPKGEGTVQSWNHNYVHEYNPARTEEDLASTFGLDIRGGALRDWNEELQSAREMPIDSLMERIDRARMIHKVLTEFGEAAMIGAKAIFDGHVTPMNPNEPTRSHVYLHNNIFFSRAVDAGVDTFKITQGDKAARKSASRDASCMGALFKLDVPELHTLATVLVDYLGTRLVCQSIVPGILHGERTHTLLYGAVEATSPLVWNEEMHNLLEKSLGKGLMVATRPVPTLPLSDERMAEIEKMKTVALEPSNKGGEEKSEENGVISNICGPIEVKAIRGSDQRKYVLDLTRLTPRDANWVPKSEGGTGVWEAVASENASSTKTQKYVPKSLADNEWSMAVLRPELTSSLTHKKMTEWFRSKAKAKEEEEIKAKSESDKIKAKSESEENKPESKSEETASKAESSKEEDDSVAKEDLNDNILENAPKPVKEGESDDAQNGKKLSTEDEDYLQSLRLNVNVFIPHIKSLKGVDDDAAEKFKEDEEKAREAALYIWNDLLPTLTKEMKDNSGHQIPVDGKSLSEMLHQRGINCRYLGRLAHLAQEEEAKDRQAEKAVQSGKSKKLPRRVMPLCWLEMLECEMVARAAKHVLDRYLTENGGTAATQPAQTIASFLSALMSIGEESAAETEVRTSKQNKSSPDEDDFNGLTMFDAGGNGDAIPPPVRGRSEVWEDIEYEVGRRFRYVLTLYNRGSSQIAKDEASNRALFIPLLRRICQRTGVRLEAKNYPIGGKCLCSGGISAGGRITASYPISPVNILDVLPLMKHSAAYGGEGFVPCSFGAPSGAPSLHILLPDAKASFEAAHVHWNARALPQALDLAQEAASLYQRVVDTPLHASVARCLDLTAVVLFQAKEPELAAANAARALAVAVQLGGFDCAESVTAHTTLSHILISSGGLASGVKHLRAALYLMELMAGPHHAELSNVYHKLGSMYYEIGSGINALRFYQEASSRKTCDRMLEGMISKSTALVLAALGEFKAAHESEKKACSIYSLILSDGHDLIKNSADTMQQFKKLAVEKGVRQAAEDMKQQEKQAADAIANQIVADEALEEEKKKKKKKPKKKKKN